MSFKLLNALICCTLVYGFTLEDLIFANGEETKEMMEKGKAQYQLLQERGRLPRYGTCWMNAVEQVHEGCRHLSEETQSDMALSLTNCFLQMSGHETYNCELDKKANLRGICINSMSDRAFNVYTEFYTHTQNMCWFLRGQVWQETIAENTIKVSKQLDGAAVNLDKMLKNQKETLTLQERMLNYTSDLEKVIEKFYISTKVHQEMISVMSGSIGSLQSWLMGEISWFDSIIFYTFAIFVVFALTSTKRTSSARLPVLFILILNLSFERYVCKVFSSKTAMEDVRDVYSTMYDYILVWRNVCVCFCGFLVLISAYFYKDYQADNHCLLKSIYDQNERLYNSLKEPGFKYFNGFPKYSNIVKGMPRKSIDISVTHECETSLDKTSDTFKSLDLSTPAVHSTTSSKDSNGLKTVVTPKFDNFSTRIGDISSRKKLPSVELLNSGRYNLRSRQGTPEVNI